MRMQGEGFQITLLYGSSHFIPAKLGKSFSKQSNLAMQLRTEELKKQGKIEAEVSKVTEDTVISMLRVTKDHILKVAKILETEGDTKNLGEPSALLPSHYGPANYGKSAEQDNKEVLFIQTGSIKGSTLKFNVGGFVFSSLFDTGAQVSCIKYDMVNTLGLLGQIFDNNINARTANGQAMGIKGSVMVNFKIGPSSFIHKFVV